MPVCRKWIGNKMCKEKITMVGPVMKKKNVKTNLMKRKGCMIVTGDLTKKKINCTLLK